MVGVERMATESRLTRTVPAVDQWLVQGRHDSWWDGPWPWLAYLIFYPLPWVWRAPDVAQLAASAAALALFLPTYFLAHRVRGPRLVAACLVMLAIGVATAPVGGGWTVFPIYAGSAAVRLRPYRSAALLIAGVAMVTTATALALGQPLLWWVSGVLLVVMTGGAGISREALHDRTEALVASQDEVRRLAGTAERERIQRDLHDVVGRTLTLVALKADLAVRLVHRDRAGAAAEMRGVADAARAGLAEVRAALAGQAGGELAHEVAASMAALETAGVAPRLVGDPAALPADAGAVLAMTLREAVTNVIRHAAASQCRIEVGLDAGAARLVVVDDGAGGGSGEGNGLKGMRQRLTAAGGSLDLDAGQSGTRLTAAVPA